MSIAGLGSGDALAVVLCLLGLLTVVVALSRTKQREGVVVSRHANKDSAGTAKVVFLQLLVEDRSNVESATREGVVRCRRLLVLL